MPSLHIKGGLLLPMTDGVASVRGDLLVQGRRITQVGDVDPPADTTVLDASGCIVMPGLVQIHVHLVQTLFRGLAEDLPLLDWLRRRVWPLEAAHDEASIRASVRLGVHELLATGTTTILDMGTSHGGDVVAEELVRSGIRARFGQAMMDAGEGVPPRLLEKTRASLDAAAGLIKRWDGQDGGRIRYSYAPRFALSCTRDLLEAVALLAKMSGSIIHTHSNENADERRLVEAATKTSPIGYLAQLGLTGERTVVAHAVHLDDEEVRTLAATRTSVAHCPSSNLKLGSGIAKVARLRDRKITVGLGADGAACNNRLDAFEEARLATLLSRVIGPDATVSTSSALLMATRDGARALGLGDEIGTLAVGKRADIVVLDGRRLAEGGDAATQVIFGGGARAVRDVVVDGEVLLREFVPTRYDRAEVRAMAGENASALLRRASLS